MPPERVVDVMALRGDSIDNIPGAPGIGDKGSVELIQRFGTVESALDRAAEVERKTYRESLQNNRDMVLLSKELVTIQTDVAVDFDPAKMQAQAPDAEAARALFTELEFNTLTREFLTESVELGETDYREAAIRRRCRSGAGRGSARSPARSSRSRSKAPAQSSAESEDAEDERRRRTAQLSLSAAPTSPLRRRSFDSRSPPKPGTALSLTLDDSAARKR